MPPHTRSQVIPESLLELGILLAAQMDQHIVPPPDILHVPHAEQGREFLEGNLALGRCRPSSSRWLSISRIVPQDGRRLREPLAYPFERIQIEVRFAGAAPCASGGGDPHVAATPRIDPVVAAFLVVFTVMRRNSIRTCSSRGQRYPLGGRAWPLGLSTVRRVASARPRSNLLVGCGISPAMVARDASRASRSPSVCGGG